MFKTETRKSRKKTRGYTMSKQTLILLYSGRSIEREMSVLSAECYACGRLQRIWGWNLLYPQSGDFYQNTELQTPGDDDRSPANDWLVRLASQAMREGMWYSLLHGPMVRMDLSRFSSNPQDYHTWIVSCHLVWLWTRYDQAPMPRGVQECPSEFCLHSLSRVKIWSSISRDAKNWPSVFT